MTTREEKRIQTLVGLGLFAIGVVAYALDEHVGREFTVHQKVQLGIAALGLLLTPLDMGPVREKVSIIASVAPWVRRPSSSSSRAIADEKPAGDE